MLALLYGPEGAADERGTLCDSGEPEQSHSIHEKKCCLYNMCGRRRRLVFSPDSNLASVNYLGRQALAVLFRQKASGYSTGNQRHTETYVLVGHLASAACTDGRAGPAIGNNISAMSLSEMRSLLTLDHHIVHKEVLSHHRKAETAQW